jgi:hypothetical protein
MAKIDIATERILARLGFAPRFLLLGDDDELSFVPKPRRRNADCSAKAGFSLAPEVGVDAVNHRIVHLIQYQNYTNSLQA